MLEEAEELEHRARRRDIVVDDETIFDFYDARVPADVVSKAHFDSWWKKERHTRPDLLTFPADLLTHDSAEQVSTADFPDSWRHADADLALDYHFEPGTELDGVTVDIPVECAQPGRGGGLLLARSRATTRARGGVDPVAAQGAARQLRPCAEPRAGVPRCDDARRGAAAGRPRAASAPDDRCGRGARGLGPRQDPAAPAAVLPRRRRCRQCPRRGQGPGSAPGRAAFDLRHGDRPGRGVRRTVGPDHVGLRRAAPHVRRDPRGARGAGLPGPGRRRPTGRRGPVLGLGPGARDGGRAVGGDAAWGPDGC